MKKIPILSVVLLLSFLWLSCETSSETDPLEDAKDDILGSSEATVQPATSVTISDLSGTNYDTGAVLPANKDEAFEVIGEGFFGQLLYAIGDYFEYVGAYWDINEEMPEGATSLYMSGDGETSGEINATISNATFTATDTISDDYDTYGWDGVTGQLNLSTANFNASFSQLSETAMKADAEASLETSCTNLRYAVDEDYTGPIYADYTINKGLFNSNIKGSILMEATSDTAGSLTHNAAISLQSGAVVSPVTTGGLGGKFIVTLDFASRATVTYSDDPSTGGVTISGDSINLTLVVKVYDNSDTLKNTYTYTIDDLASLGDSSDLMVSTINKTAKKMTLSTIKR